MLWDDYKLKIMSPVSTATYDKNGNEGGPYETILWQYSRMVVNQDPTWGLAMAQFLSEWNKAFLYCFDLEGMRA